MTTSPFDTPERLHSLPPKAPMAAWRRAFRDLPREHGFEPLRLEGAIPADLRGTLFRNGPANFSIYGDRLRHWFDGDGAVSGVRITDNGVSGAVRFVGSAGRDAERAAQKRLHGAYGTTAPSVFRQIHSLLTQRKNQANTSVMIWQGRLYALLEAAMPVELSPDDLHTFGERDLGGAVLSTFSAHPHYVPSRQAAYNFGVRYGRETLLDLFELPDEGPARRIHSLPLAGATMIHDFIVTERHLVFFAPPLRLNTRAFFTNRASFGDSLQWKPDLGTEVIAVPIDDPTHPTRFTTDAFYQWHFANAFEREDKIIIDFVRYSDFSSNQYLGSVVADTQRGSLDGTLHRAELSLARKSLHVTELCSTLCDFPRVAGRALTKPYRYVYTAAQSASSDGMSDVLMKLDLDSGASTTVSLGAAQYPSEPVFVRRSDAEHEDDGYLLTLNYDALQDASHLAVLDARNLASGPIARAWFDHHIPLSFHGNWSPAR